MKKILGYIDFQYGCIVFTLSTMRLMYKFPIIEINEVIAFIKERGIITLETRYGYECIDLYDIASKMGLAREDVTCELYKIDGFAIKIDRKMNTIRRNELYKEGFFLIEDYIAFCAYEDKTQKKMIKAVDLSDGKNIALFTVKDDDYEMFGSTFPDGKRFYEMLHILERKKRYIIDSYIKLANPKEWRRKNKEYNEELRNKKQEEIEQ